MGWRFAVSAFLLSLLLAPSLGADGPLCSDADFWGTYAFQSQGFFLVNNSPVTIAGSLQADGQGNITAWKDWKAFSAGSPTPPFKPPVLLSDYGSAGIRYKVEPDCRIVISGAVPGPAPGTSAPLVMVGALADKGNEALLMNGSEASPFLTVVTMRRSSRRVD